MSIHAFKPWTELVKLHADVESGTLAEAVFAIVDLAVLREMIEANVAYLVRLAKPQK